MFFKRALEHVPSLAAVALMGAALALPLGGCGLRLGDGLPEGTLKLSASEGAACLNGGGFIFAEFLEGRAQDGQISGLWDCARRSLQLFGERTRGARTGVYTPQELRHFLEKHFLLNYKISDGLLTEAMELKRNLLGGRTDSLTLSELQQLQRLMDLFKHHSLALRPYMPLTPERLETVSHDTLNQAVRALEAAAVDLGAILKGRGFQYPFTRLDQLLREIEAMYGGLAYRSRAGFLRSNLPLVRQLKALLVSPDSSQIDGEEWDALLLSAAQGYGLVLRTAHLMKNQEDFTSGTGLESLKELFRGVDVLLERAISRRPEKMIPTLELEQFIYLMRPDENELAVLGQLVPKSHLRELVRVLVQRVLGGSRPGPEGRDAKGLTLPALKRAEGLFREWADGQAYLETLIHASVARDSALDAGWTSPLDQLRGAVIPQQGLSQIPAGQDAAARLRDLIAWEKPYFYGDEAEIDFGRIQAPGQLQFTWGGLSKMHWMDILARLLVTGYSESPERAEHGDRVTFAELEKFYYDFRPIGIDLLIFDPLNTDVVRKRFLEANLFTYSADGSGVVVNGRPQGWLTVDEGRQYLAYLVSGKALSARLHQDIAARCPYGLKQSKDYYGFDYLEAGCFRETFFGNLQRYWGHFPRLVDHFKRSTIEEKVKFACDLELITRREGFSESPLDSSDTETFGVLPHYIETLYMRFDPDSSGFLSARGMLEGDRPAFEVFRKVLSQAVQQQTGEAPSEARLKSIFTFYLAHGRQPTTSEYLSWYGRHYLTGNWKFKTDRGMLLSMLADFTLHSDGFAAPGAKVEARSPEQQVQACQSFWQEQLKKNPTLFRVQ